MINNVLSDIYDEYNKDYTDFTVKSKFNKHEAFQKLDKLREILKGHADINYFKINFKSLRVIFELCCWILIYVQKIWTFTI